MPQDARQKTWPTQPFPRQGTWTEHREFFVDAGDGTPLGSIQESTTRVPGQPTMTSRVVETVQAIEHLEPTPGNLAKLGR